MKSLIFDYQKNDLTIGRGIGNQAMVDQVGNSERQIISTLEVEHTQEDREQLEQMDEGELADILADIVNKNPFNKMYPN